MMKRDLKDTYTAARSTIAARILASPLASCVGYPADIHRLARLQEIAAGAALGGFSCIDVEFRRADTSATISVEKDESWGDDKRTDEKGNEFVEVTLRPTVNYPCHGSAGPGVVMARLNLTQQVTMLAAEIEAEFCNRKSFWRMTRTAAEVAETKAKLEAEQRQAFVVRVIDANRKHMKVGAEKTLGDDLVVGLPSGTYTHEFGDGKKFSLFVTESKGATMMRTA
jgi:hypothetical protein